MQLSQRSSKPRPIFEAKTKAIKVGIEASRPGLEYYVTATCGDELLVVTFIDDLSQLDAFG